MEKAFGIVIRSLDLDRIPMFVSVTMFDLNLGWV
jgi:hypothetical protein